MTLQRIHRAVAALLLLFITAHLGINFYGAVGGPERHAAALDIVRKVYRVPLLEVVMLGAFVLQMLTGVAILRRRYKADGRPKGWAAVQAASGAYLVVFITAHAGAALNTRFGMGLDTNFYWPAATLQGGVLRIVFALYYAAAIVAIFSHIAAALHYRGSRVAPILPAVGAVVALIIVAGFAGAFFDIDLPADYADYFEKMRP